MKLLAANVILLLLAAVLPLRLNAQEAAAPAGSNESKIDLLVKKIDEQNSKIDTLSQQILKLEQQIANIRPGVMIGEATPPSTAATAVPAAPAAPHASAATGNAHVVAKGETLTSIAKTYKVGVQDLQKFNHIENDRALQIGQTIMIPTPGGASASPSPASPNQ
jgi:LysM repeat protein